MAPASRFTAIDLIERLSNALSSKLGIDLIWNLGSFVVLGVSGILLNFLIGRYFGAETLGAFNQVFAFYILISQFAVFGIQFSALKHTAELYETNALELRRNAYAALALALLIAVLVLAVGYPLSRPIGSWLDSELVGAGLVLAMPGIALFALNKVLINIVNGLRHMRAFAVAQSARYLSILATAVGLVWLDVDGVYLPIAFTIAEGMLVVMLGVHVARHVPFCFDHGTRQWVGRHLSFGARGFLSGAAAELNTRVDVLMLGAFMADRAVGLYSMASMLAEGLVQLSVVVRNNVNPLITQHHARGELDALRSLARKTVVGFYLAMLVAVIPAVLLYPFAIEWLTGSAEFAESWPVFAVLCVGILLASGYLPLEMALIQAGFPNQQTWLRCLTVVSNLLLNAALIPLLGIMGAAIATGASFVLTVVYLNVLVRRHLRVGF